MSRTVVSLRIEPSMATLSSISGSKPTQRFTVFTKLADGSETESTSAVLNLEPTPLGALRGATFEANGLIGGTAQLTADLNGRRALAIVVVNLASDTRAAALDAPTVDTFHNTPALADPALDANVVYPLDGVVMPQNVYPVDVAWTRGSAGDLFKVSLKKAHISVSHTLLHDGENHWLVDAAGWQALARTDADQPATLTVERLEKASGKRIVSAPRSITFARAAIAGTVYYWDIEAGRIRRINDGSGVAESFLPTPPPTEGGSACIGCHSISNSGRYMAGRLGLADNIGAVFDLTTDLTGSPATTVWPSAERNLRWFFSSWSPDDTRMIVSAGPNPGLALYDPMRGVALPFQGALPLRATMPSWSPDGKHIAYVNNPDEWGSIMTRGDIAMLDVTAADTFDNARTIHEASKLANGACDSYPSWSPDSKLLAFGHGTGAKSERDSGDLFLLTPDGSKVQPLDKANSGVSIDFQPHFSPFNKGGYYWLSFLSRRTYGNTSNGNVTRLPARRQQIWVTAIKADTPPDADLSSVPYWLPGQDPLSSNIAAFWAPRACRTDGESCNVSTECCGGECRPDSANKLVCSPPPPEKCRAQGQTCSASTDCCMGDCIDRVCLDAKIF